MPSARRPASNDASGRVEPCAFSAAKPIGTSSKVKPSETRCSTPRNTCSVAAVISGPMPSPGMTTRCVRLDMRGLKPDDGEGTLLLFRRERPCAQQDGDRDHEIG